MGWHDERFIEHPDRHRFDCEVCGRGMWFPLCKLGKYKTCGSECSERIRAGKLKARERNCVTCGKQFNPRWRQIRNTGGKYCSNRCSTLPRLQEMSAKGAAASKAAHAEGRIKLPTGPANKQWKGGHKEAIKRYLADGRLTARVRKYRAENPTKTREWYQNRRGRKTGRLPRGYLVKLYELQRGKCPVCKDNLGKSYHTDHINPLAAGGEHIVGNIQLLCQHCNCTKSAKDPIKFMQECGFLI